MTKLFLFDIEGTTTDIDFVHKVLFPYSKKNLETYILNNQTHPVVAAALQDVQETVLKEDQRTLGLTETIAQLQKWINEDRKHKALKDIQGLIWDVGYSKNDFKGHVYSDVKPFFRKILDLGGKVGIYSSGSIHAQKLVFGYSEEGDLTPFISFYFDTTVGGKKEISSYKKIAHEVKMKESEIHFFSDIIQELEAAHEAGLSVTQVLRPGTKAGQFETIKNFEEFSS